MTPVRDCVISRTALGFVRTLHRTMGARRYHRGKHCFAKLFTSSSVGESWIPPVFEMVVIFFRTIVVSFKSQVDRLSPTKISCTCYVGKHLKSVKCCTFRMQIVFTFQILNWHSSIVTVHDTFNFYNGKYRLLINWKLCVCCSYLFYIKTLY